MMASLRFVALAVGYCLPMILLFTPVEIPARYLWSGIAQHRGLTDLCLILVCPALVWVAQSYWPLATVGRPRASNEIVTLSVKDLFDATSGFSSSAELGRGSFGIVFATRGSVRSLAREGRCAVKRLHNSKPETFAGLHREVRLLGKCRHENLLPLLGFCLDHRALCLVYPLLVGGNLDDRLHRSSAGLERIAHLQPPGQLHTPAIGPLGWRERLRIVRDATRALVYLHTPCGDKVHRLTLGLTLTEDWTGYTHD